MKIVVLNESFLTPQHIAHLRNLGEVETYTGTNSRELAIERLQGATVAIGDCFFVPFDNEFFNAVDGLKLLCINSTGFDSVDLRAATKNNVLVANTPGFSTEAVAEHTFALLFAVVRRITLSDARMKELIYEIDPADPAQSDLLGFQLAGKQLGIIGVGAIGRRVAEIGQAMGMHVAGYNRSPFKLDAVKQVPLNELLQTSDVISVHIAAAPELENLINAEKLSLMKTNAVLINTGRGKLVSTNDLYAALKNKRLSGAGLDVVGPGDKAQDLVKLPNVVASPHDAFFTQEAIKNLADLIVANVEDYVGGQPHNIVNELSA